MKDPWRMMSSYDWMESRSLKGKKENLRPFPKLDKNIIGKVAVSQFSQERRLFDIVWISRWSCFLSYHDLVRRWWSVRVPHPAGKQDGLAGNVRPVPSCQGPFSPLNYTFASGSILGPRIVTAWVLKCLLMCRILFPFPLLFLLIFFVKAINPFF